MKTLQTIGSILLMFVVGLGLPLAATALSVYIGLRILVALGVLG